MLESPVKYVFLPGHHVQKWGQNGWWLEMQGGWEKSWWSIRLISWLLATSSVKAENSKTKYSCKLMGVSKKCLRFWSSFLCHIVSNLLSIYCFILHFAKLPFWLVIRYPMPFSLTFSSVCLLFAFSLKEEKFHCTSLGKWEHPFSFFCLCWTHIVWFQCSQGRMTSFSYSSIIQIDLLELWEVHKSWKLL